MHFIPAHDGPRGTLRRAIADAANPTPREYHVTSEKNAADWLRCLAGSTAVGSPAEGRHTRGLFCGFPFYDGGETAAEPGHRVNNTCADCVVFPFS